MTFSSHTANWRLKLGLITSLASLPALSAVTEISQIPLPTYQVTSTTDVKPNIMFILDDSGSMDWDYMPDWADVTPAALRANSAFNGVAYNPAIRYTPPIAINTDGSINTTRFPSMTGQSTATGADSTTKPNWKRVKRDGFGVQSTSTDDLTNSATYYVVVPGEYCNSPKLTNCIAATAPTGQYVYPSYLRWCNNTGLTTCRANWDSTYNKARIPVPKYYGATLTFSSADSGQVSSVKVGTTEILSARTDSSSTSSTVASRVATNINACTTVRVGNCQTTGYKATVSGSTVTIIPPTTTSATVSVTRSNVSVTINQFGTIAENVLSSYGVSNSTASAIPGENLAVIIQPGQSSYPYPGSTTKAPGRTDCAGTTCTYAEEMTNYANWWAYYQTRMQLMKSAASFAFANLDTPQDITNGVSRFRLGYLSINNNTGSDFLNPAEFTTSQKSAWFNKLFAATPNNATPLREALSKVGRLYAGRLNGSSLNGSTVVDPLQYSCQQNFAILSSDGYWNGNDGFKLDGSTSVGNQDGAWPRPYNDGATAFVQKRTSQLQTRSVIRTAERGILQSRTTQRESRTSNLQRRTSSNSGSSWTSWTNVSSCEPDPDGRNRTECQYTPWTEWAPVSSCTSVAQDFGDTWSVTNGIARECQTRVISNWSDVEACSPSTTNGLTTECQYRWEPRAATATCTPTFSSGNYTNAIVYRNCSITTRTWQNVSSGSCTVNATTECQYTGWTNWSNVTSCAELEQSTTSPYTTTTAVQCQQATSGGTSDTLADVAAYYYITDLRNPAATGANQTGTCNGPIYPPSTTPYNLCTNNVPTYGRDTVSTQHMTTYTLGLGAQGLMLYSDEQNDAAGNRVYNPDYWSQPSGDFYDILTGSVANASAGICTWQSSGICTWPTPASGNIRNIDDLWHAAVNGRGTYFSAKDPQTLSQGLASTLVAISQTPRPGASSAAAASNPNVSFGDNYIFNSSYRSIEWWGELVRQQIDPLTGAISAVDWSARQALGCALTPWRSGTDYVANDVFGHGGACYVVTSDYKAGENFAGSESGLDGQNTDPLLATPVTRKVYVKGSAGSLVDFTYTNLGSAQSYFTRPYITYTSETAGLTQFCGDAAGCLSATQQGLAEGTELVKYLAGDRTYEGSYFRPRKQMLGDIVSSEARYVKSPTPYFSDPGFDAYREGLKDRKGVVYVGANDGMLHAFNADNGEELWAFVPTAVLPNLYKLADTNYDDKHQTYVDGSIEIGDICPNSPSGPCSATQWKTILVGGLGAGGKAFYALDITDPASPKMLWEFTHTNLGNSYANPRITKLKNGTWVVIVTSGYNNADGKGYLFVLNAGTGEVIKTISTGVGSATDPSGLSKIAAYAINPEDNVVDGVYGGDLFGNLWRFDVNDATGTALKLISFTDASGRAQPITTKPVVSLIGDKPVVFVGTGRYLGLSDITGTAYPQSFYAVKDSGGNATMAGPRTGGSGFKSRSLTSSTCPANAPIRTCSPGQTVRSLSGAVEPVNWTSDNGWYIDFFAPDERSVTDPSLTLGILNFTTIQPNLATLGVCGAETPDTSSGIFYEIDARTGTALLGNKGVLGVTLGIGIVTRPVLVRLKSGGFLALVRLPSRSAGEVGDQGQTLVRQVDVPLPGTLRKGQWRILTGK